MRDRRKRNIIIGSLCCLLVFMGIGYALLSQTLNINGTATMAGEWKIYIDSITVKETGGDAESIAAEVSNDKQGASFDLELLKPGDYVEYELVVKNDGTINAVLRELIPNIEADNMDILLTHSIIQGQILKAESQTTFTLKIRFDERATDVVSGGKTSFDIRMVYQQYDGDASGIDPTLAPVTANDCFTIDGNGVITGYDYSCGTYVTVPAVVNGTTVTEINNVAFTKHNLIMYDEGAPIVAKTQEAYNIAYTMLGPDGEGLTDEEISQILFMEGDPNIPDVTDLYMFAVYVTEDGEVSLPISNIEYLDLSQATALKKIESGAFTSNSSGTILKYLNLDKTQLEELGRGGFMFAELDSLTITTDMHKLFFDMAGTIDTLIVYPGSTTEIPDVSEYKDYTDYQIIVNNLIIEEGITRIGANTFAKGSYGSWDIKNVEFPKNLIEIGYRAFYDSSITNINLPTNLKIIGKQAFQTSDLNSLVIPAAVETIGDFAFSNNSNLSSLIFEKKSSMTTIGNYAFASTNLSEVVLENVVLGGVVFGENGISSLELIGKIEFDNNINGNSVPVASNLINLKIKSDTLKVIPERSFGFDSTVESTLDFLNKNATEVNSSIKTIGDYAFNEATPKTLNLPTSLEIVGNGAFSSLNPTKLLLPNTIKNIGAFAFGNLKIENLVIPSSIEYIGNQAFNSMPSTSTITVNKAVGSFTTGAAWSGNANVVYNS